MSLNYTQLQARIAAYLKRDDLTSDIPYAITMAEGELNRRLAILQMEEIKAFTLAQGADTVTFSSIDTTCIAVLEIVYIDANDVLHVIEYMDPVKITAANSTTDGRPNFWTVTGGESVYFEREADQSYSLIALFRNRFDLASTTTNYLGNYQEDLYLNLSLAYMEPFIKNDKRVVLWRTFAETAIQQLDEMDTKARAQRKAYLVPDITSALRARGRYDINQG